MGSLSSIFDRYTLIKQIPLFGNLNWFQLQTIAFKSKIFEFKKGEVVIRQGELADGLYCLISGRLRCYALDPGGKKYDVDFIRRGSSFGVTALLADDNHSHSFEAINDSIVLKINKEDFHDILHSIPSLGVELSHSLSRRIRHRTSPERTAYANNIISVYCPVKGTGSSTYAVNLALSLEREAHKKVILVTIDSAVTAGAAPAAGQPGSAAPAWTMGGIPLEDIVGDYDRTMQSISRGALSVDYLKVSFPPDNALLVDQISHFVTALINDYHYVVVDLPNEMDDVVLKTLAQSDIIQLITLDRPQDLQGTRQVINRLEEALKEYFDPEKIQVIIRDSAQGQGLPLEEINRLIDFDVYIKLPLIADRDLAERKETPHFAFTALASECAYAQVVRKTARQISNVLVGLVLGGGAALGLAHIGVLRVLEQEKIPVDIVVGSSMGALLGSLWVTGKSADDIEKLAREFETRRGILKLVDPVVPISGFIGGQAIKKWLRRHLGQQIFYHTRIPLKIVAYDIVKRKEIVINSGSLVDAVMRSIAIPGVISPILDKERVIIDGGVLNPLPTNVLRGLGIRKIIAINVLQSPDDVTKGYIAQHQRLEQQSRVPFRKSPLGYVGGRIKNRFKRLVAPSISNIIVCTLQATEYVIAEQSGAQADVLIHPDLVGLNWYEFYKVEEFVRRGEEAARQALPEIRRLVDQ